MCVCVCACVYVVVLSMYSLCLGIPRDPPPRTDRFPPSSAALCIQFHHVYSVPNPKVSNPSQGILIPSCGFFFFFLVSRNSGRDDHCLGKTRVLVLAGCLCLFIVEAFCWVVESAQLESECLSTLCSDRLKTREGPFKPGGAVRKYVRSLGDDARPTRKLMLSDQTFSAKGRSWSLGSFFFFLLFLVIP